jgi:hypothetical protein
LTNNKYTKWYYKIIDNRKENPHPNEMYTERHHIIPKSFGGSNRNENLVRLSAREHFLVHWLLVKMCANKDHAIKMNHALLRLMSASTALEKHQWSKWQYEIARINKSEALSESRKIGNCPRKGKKHSAASKEKMRIAKLGVKRDPAKIEYLKECTHSDETKEKIGNALKGRVFSEESRKKSSLTQKGKKQNKTLMICDVCGVENYATQIKRYHNDNCKHKG